MLLNFFLVVGKEFNWVHALGTCASLPVYHFFFLLFLLILWMIRRNLFFFSLTSSAGNIVFTLSLVSNFSISWYTDIHPVDIFFKKLHVQSSIDAINVICQSSLMNFTRDWSSPCISEKSMHPLRSSTIQYRFKDFKSVVSTVWLLTFWKANIHVIY